MSTASPRLGLLTGTRLLTNGSFRYLYPFLPIVAADLGLASAQAGILVSSLALGGMLGPFVRRWLTGGTERPRHLLVTSVLMTSVGILGASVAPVVPVAVACFVIIGAGKPMVDIASISYVSERTPYDRRARAMSLMETTWAGGLVVVAPIAGVIAARTSWRVPLAALGLLVALTAIPVTRLLAPDPSSQRVAVPRAQIAKWTRIEVQLLAMMVLVFGMLESTFSVFGLWLDADYGVSLEGLGGLAAATALGELVGALVVFAIADRFGKHRTAIGGMVLCSGALAFLPFAATLPIAIVALAVALAGSEATIVAVLPMASEVQPASRTRFLAAMMAAASLGRAFAAFIGGLTFDTVGIGGNVILSVASGVLAIVALLWVVHKEPRLKG